jgi:capsular polysaccharide biosynthesis protein
MLECLETETIGKICMMTEPRQIMIGENVGGEDALSLRSLFRIIWKWLWVILLVVLLVTGTVLGFTLSQPPQYQASIKMLVGEERGIGETPQDAASLQDLTTTVATAISTRPVADAVIEELDLQTTPDYLLAGLSAEPIPDTVFVEVSYTDTDPERTKQVVETFGSVLSDRITEVNSEDSTISVTVWENAVVPVAPVGPDPIRRGFFALVFGGILGIGLAFLLEYLDDRWQSPEEAELISGVPTFGVIPEFAISQDGKKG